MEGVHGAFKQKWQFFSDTHFWNEMRRNIAEEMK
jgi:hypothetical protein